jgi:hypothetical protein
MSAKRYIGLCSWEGWQGAKRLLEGNPKQGFPSKSVRAASSEPAALEGELGKAKPSMVASAVSGSFPPFYIYSIEKHRQNFRAIAAEGSRRAPSGFFRILSLGPGFIRLGVPLSLR